jgi:hypothetical protein
MAPNITQERVRSVLIDLGVSPSTEAAQAVMDAVNDVPNVRIVVGPDTQSLRVLVDGQDVTKALCIKRLVIKPMEASEVVEATFTVMAQAEVELLPENVTVVVTDPESPAHDKTMCEVCGKPTISAWRACSSECADALPDGLPAESAPYTGYVTKP